MKDYNSMKHTLLVFNSKETLVDTIIEQDKEKDRLKERLSLYESNTDTVVMSKDKWEEIKQEIERLNKKIEQYENPEDMTLMFMWCDEKAKDEIKRLNNIIKVKDEGFKASTEDLCETTEELEKANNIINKMNDYLVMNIANGSLDFMYRQGFKDCYEKLIELKGSDSK